MDALKKAESILLESESVNWIIRQWRGLPEPKSQKTWVEKLQNQVNKSSEALDLLEKEQNINIAKKNEILQTISNFNDKYSTEPDDILNNEEQYRLSMNQETIQNQAIEKELFTTSRYLSKFFSEKLEILQTLGYGKRNNGSINDMFSCLEEAFEQIGIKIQKINIEYLRDKLLKTNKRIAEINTEISTTEARLNKVEESIISQADIIATTLTRAYLKESIRSRSYDTIIIDEASMAPIPAIWAAASLATNAIVVGDWMQLPPIVLSEDKIAQKWLGTDIFEVAKVNSSEPKNLIKLHEQYRMLPAIAKIPDILFYGGGWEYSRRDEFDENFSAWYNLDWKQDSPVVLIDTGSINAWVTSVPRGKSSSRLNFMSAMVCIDICKILLRENAPIKDDNSADRIFIECPYRPHAEFVNTLLLEYGLSKNVRAGTIHSFQGSEADVVIFDLVNDEPHWRVNLFNPESDEMTKKLLNVGITRAKNRLIVVGDFSYNEIKAKNSFLGKTFLPHLKATAPLLNALDVIPLGIKTRAAQASSQIYSGTILDDAPQIIVTQDNFYPLIIKDINSAKERIVIFSPFITKNRITELQLALSAATERAIKVYVITKPIQERSKADKAVYKFLEKSLQNWGITIIHKGGMHEKLVLVDKNILWYGSLNTLSYSNTQEIMERRIGENLVTEFSKISLFNKLIDEFKSETPTCPICGSEMIANEGKDNPFYWRCVIEGCYSRSVDQPQIKNGVIVCANCGGDLEFGAWGEELAWRCKSNKHHHQRFSRTHLKLPLMKNKLPLDRLSEIEKNFGLVSDTLSSDGTSQLVLL